MQFTHTTVNHIFFFGSGGYVIKEKNKYGEGLT